MPHLIGRLATLGLFVFATQSAFAKLLPCTPWVTDFSLNIQATDKDKFHMSPNAYSNVELDVPGGTFGVPAMVQKRNAAPTLSLTWRNPNARGDPNGTVDVYDAKFVDSQGNVFPLTLNGSSTYTQSVSIPAMGAFSISPIQLSNFPNYVTIGYVRYSFLISSPTGIGLGGINIGLKTYLVDDTPNNYQSVPWFNVLDLACTWADGEAGTADCAYDVTFGLYYSQLFAYNLGTSGVPSVWFDWGVDDKFKLKEFFETWGYRDGNCVDVSTFNSICMNSLGVSTALNRQNQASAFITNPMCPIGSDSTNLGNYRLVKFTMHQQAHVSGNVFDAALALINDLSGATYKNPPADWPMGAPGYWQTPAVSPLYGLTKRYFDPVLDVPTLNPTLPSQAVTYSTSSFSYPGVK